MNYVIILTALDAKYDELAQLMDELRPEQGIISDVHIEEIVPECKAALAAFTHDEILDAKLDAHADAVANHEDQQHE
jgi:hypothetical protein